MITLLYAHPYSRHSRVNRYLLQFLGNWSGVEVRNLYEMYPDFYIDVATERQQLEQSNMVVLQYPMQWSLPPALLVQYLDKVFGYGWAYGQDHNQQISHRLAGKVLWVVANGLLTKDGQEAGTEHMRALSPLKSLAKHCGMQWASPLLIPHQQSLTDTDLQQLAVQYRERLLQLSNGGADAS